MAKYRFRLLHGQHIEADKSKPLKDAEGKPTGRFEPKKYEKGAVIDSDTDLAAKLGPNKFELLSGAAAEELAGLEQQKAELEREIAALKAEKADAPPVDAAAPTAPVAKRDLEAEHGGDFHKLTVKELHDIADAEEIDLDGAHNKDDIVKALRKGAKGK